MNNLSLFIYVVFYNKSYLFIISHHFKVDKMEYICGHRSWKIKALESESRLAGLSSEL